MRKLTFPGRAQTCNETSAQFLVTQHMLIGHCRSGPAYWSGHGLDEYCVVARLPEALRQLVPTLR